MVVFFRLRAIQYLKMNISEFENRMSTQFLPDYVHVSAAANNKTTPREMWCLMLSSIIISYSMLLYIAAWTMLFYLQVTRRAFNLCLGPCHGLQHGDNQKSAARPSWQCEWTFSCESKDEENCVNVSISALKFWVLPKNQNVFFVLTRQQRPLDDSRRWRREKIIFSLRLFPQSSAALDNVIVKDADL